MVRRQSKMKGTSGGRTVLRRMHALIEKMRTIQRPYGYNEEDWQGYTRWIASIAMQVDWEEQEDDEEYLIDMMWDMEHPPRKSRSDWTGFLGHLGDGVKELTEFKHDVIFAPIYRQANMHKITNQMEPATPDTMMKVEQSLLMPRQEDETSSIEER